MADCTYTVPDLALSGDEHYGRWICDQVYIDFFWDSYGFTHKYWQDGWGFDDCCNIRKPLARTFTAMYLLDYSADDWQNEDWNSDILHWGARYAREQFSSYNDLRADCGDGSAIATTTGCQSAREDTHYGCTDERDEAYKECRTWHWLISWLCIFFVWLWHKVCVAWGYIKTFFCILWYGTAGGGENITFHLQFFYPLDGSGNLDVVARAATIIHESRHAGDKPHNATFAAGSDYGAGNDGADSDWNYQGAWMYMALYQWWYYAASARSTVELRASARRNANYVITQCFANNPGFVV